MEKRSLGVLTLVDASNDANGANGASGSNGPNKTSLWTSLAMPQKTYHAEPQHHGCGSTTAIEQDIGHLAGTTRNKELDGLVDGGDERAQDGSGRERAT